ncbi:FAD-dependent oxidoreductase [Kocuria coralli]|uniref:FAD-dependent oxidoreductase n=1 Tax=Kocuria coralli TaxID=1461025 RepID=A0A5J5L127_9MICC|nr:NAD(P)/FAD-dependent oxidoreductase [Kocuria coralli]KAA9394905.1 FAD-dependent oxidoreductase [Kocuria coralli]
MSETTDLLVVGAGPAGLAAAVTAADHGLRVMLVDAGPQPGGQYWRHPDERYPVADESAGHHGWKVLTKLRDRLRVHRGAGHIDYRPGTQVWFIEAPKTESSPWYVYTTASVEAQPDHVPTGSVRAMRIVLCPGGYDRQLPVPGWDLPGVMAAGGVQALLKGSRTLAGRRAVVAGTGPFLLPVAVGLAEAGAEVVAICEAGNLTGWAKNVTGAVQVPSKGVEGAEYAKALVKHRIPYKTSTAVTRIDGDGQVQSAVLTALDRRGRPRSGSERAVEVDLVAFGWGFTPSMELVQAVGAETRIGSDESLIAVVDDMQRSTASRVYIAGEATGVGGAMMAVAEGELAGLGAAGDNGSSIDGARVRKLRGIIRRSAAFAQAMHHAHPVPARWTDWLTEDTLVCRCEEVTYAQVCHARDDLSADEARSVKILARPGMGWCQGRVCGFACAKIAAANEDRDLSPDDLARMSKRSLATPVSLEDLADLTLE